MILGIGLSKTGTTSLNEALAILGLRSLHYPDPALMLDGRYREALAGFDAATDITVSMCFETLDRAFPGSRFILTIRDRDAWLDSLAGHMARRHFDASTPRGRVRARLYGTDCFDRDTLALAFDRFHARVDAHFAGRDDLLRMSICAGEGWDALCPFLGLQPPGHHFPRLNASPSAAA